MCWLTGLGAKRRSAMLHPQRPVASPPGAVIDLADISADEIAHLAGEVGFSGVVSLARLEADHRWIWRSGSPIEVMPFKCDRDTVRDGLGMQDIHCPGGGIADQEVRLGVDTTLADCARSRQFHFGPKVTVGQLLNHTSGISDYFSEEVESDYAALWRERPCYRMTSIRDFLPRP
jgi:hypothetical protein